jgi:hypothetical protein
VGKYRNGYQYGGFEGAKSFSIIGQEKETAQSRFFN